MPKSGLSEIDSKRIVGGIRGGDEAGHEIFAIKLGGRPEFFGEYRPRWHDNGPAFDIEIVDFGYVELEPFGLFSRQSFLAGEKAEIMRLAISLFRDPEAQRNRMPFGIKGSRFTGEVHFASDWLRETN